MNKKTIICATLLIETSPQALPLGAACIASAIKNNKLTKDLFNVELLTLSLESSKEPINKLVEKILLHKELSFVCFSVYVWNKNFLEEAAKKIKEKNKDIIIIAGGPEVTAHPDVFNYFDYTISGQGEVAVPTLINNIINAASLEKITLPQGVYSKKIDNKLTTRAITPNLEELSSPYLDNTLDPSLYNGALWELARGCPFKCSYCYESKGEKHIKYFSIERIKEELKLFNKKNISQVFVLDPTYNANKTRALQILKLIKENAPGMFFYFEARAEYIDKELAKAFTQIPCALQIGLQSANPEVLQKVNRSLDKKKFEKNINLLNQTGAIFGFDLIYGLPTDTFSGFKQSINFALNLYPNNLETFCLSVLPGTDLYEKAKEFNLIYEENPPYNLIKSPSYPEEEIKKSKKLSSACNIFYNQGRAVPWFMTLVRFLHTKPVNLLEDFEKWYTEFYFSKTKTSIIDYDVNCNNHKQIEELQINFIKYLLNKKNKQNYFDLIQNIISLNGAISRVEENSTLEQNVKLLYHPDDLLSPYATDIEFFYKNAPKRKNTCKVYKNKNQINWKVL